MTGITHDNGEIAVVAVNGKSATIINNHSGVADWSIELLLPVLDYPILLHGTAPRKNLQTNCRSGGKHSRMRGKL